MRELALVCAAACVLLLACSGKTEATPGSPSESAASSATAAKIAAQGTTVSASLVGYNHTDKTIAAFYVDGVWGGNITPGSGGGSFVCCADLPDPWHEGLSVTITWEDHESKMQKRIVPVPQYDPKTIAGFKVHFLRDGQIKVFANRVMLGHPDYPLAGKEAELKPGVPIEKVS
jgi:hypothetical protein